MEPYVPIHLHVVRKVVLGRSYQFFPWVLRGISVPTVRVLTNGEDMVPESCTISTIVPLVAKRESWYEILDTNRGGKNNTFE